MAAKRHQGWTIACGIAAMAAGLAIPPTAAGAVFTDEAAMLSGLNWWQAESFEAMAGVDPVQSLGFGGAGNAGVVSANVSTVGVTTNTVVYLSDGYGAIAADGDYFWRLRGQSITIDFGADEFDVFGFSFSDLELGSMAITFQGDSSQTIFVNEQNPDENLFIGYAGAETFSSVTIWLNSSVDSIGIDRVIVGSTTIPSPGGVSLAALALLAASPMRRRRQTS